MNGMLQLEAEHCKCYIWKSNTANATLLCVYTMRTPRRLAFSWWDIPLLRWLSMTRQWTVYIRHNLTVTCNCAQTITITLSRLMPPVTFRSGWASSTWKACIWRSRVDVYDSATSWHHKEILHTKVVVKAHIHNPTQPAYLLPLLCSNVHIHQAFPITKLLQHLGCKCQLQKKTTL